MQSEKPNGVCRNSSSGSPRSPCIAVRMSCCASSERNCNASNRFDLPLAFGPTMAVSGSRSRLKASNVLKPSISIRVSIAVRYQLTFAATTRPGASRAGRRAAMYPPPICPNAAASEADRREGGLARRPTSGPPAWARGHSPSWEASSRVCSHSIPTSSPDCRRRRTSARQRSKSSPRQASCRPSA